MANLVIYNDETRRLGEDLGYSMWNIAVHNAPMRTGNLRSNIFLQQNGPKVKRIYYNDYDAYYLNYLEAGQGRNKMHKGFIEDKTVGSILMETYAYLLTGQTTFSGIPSITLKNDKPRNYERTMLQQAGLNVNKRISAFDRALLSSIFAKSEGASRTNGFSMAKTQIPDVWVASTPKLRTVNGRIVER